MVSATFLQIYAQHTSPIHNVHVAGWKYNERMRKTDFYVVVVVVVILVIVVIFYHHHHYYHYYHYYYY
jgi:hypothetical protein